MKMLKVITYMIIKFSFIITDLTCWLISELLGVRGSSKLRELNINLQTDIFKTLSQRNPQQFFITIEDYLQTGLGNLNVLYFIL